MSDPDVWLWRHPRPRCAAGCCVGSRSDVAVDRRRARRLARRIAATARREGLPRVVWTSPLRRCVDVGRVLKRRHGFAHRVDPRLAELDFGRWEGRPWKTIAPEEVARWERDFLHHAPGGGEALAALLERVRGFLAEQPAGPLFVVGHAGWISGLASLLRPEPPTAASWPRAIGYGALRRLPRPV